MQQIAEDVWQIALTPRQGINAYLIGDVLIDAGIRWSGGTLRRILRNRPLGAHALTHAHPDHQGATAEVCTKFDIPLMCHEAEREAAETGDTTRAFPNPGSLVARIQRRLSGPGHPVARTLSEGEEVAGFEVIETPGHAPGHISFWRASDRLLIAGDAAVGMDLLTTKPRIGLPLGIATTDMEEAKRSIARLADLEPDRVAFGHGPVAPGEAFGSFARSLSLDA